MTATSFLFLFCAIALGSLVLVSWFNRREQQQKLLNKRMRQMRVKAQHLEELVIEVDQLMETRSVARLINDELLDLALIMKESSPQATYIDAIYQSCLTRGEALLDESNSQEPNRLKDSDVQIARSKQALEEAAVIIRRQHGRGKISAEEQQTFIHELGWAHLMVEVLSYVGQGHRKIRRGDFLSAHSFYKKAQHLLMKSNHSDGRRHRFIKELAEMLHNKRAALSTDLMPESHLNPKEKADTSPPPSGTAVTLADDRANPA